MRIRNNLTLLELKYGIIFLFYSLLDYFLTLFTKKYHEKIDEKITNYLYLENCIHHIRISKMKRNEIMKMPDATYITITSAFTEKEIPNVKNIMHIEAERTLTADINEYFNTIEEYKRIRIFC